MELRVHVFILLVGFAVADACPLGYELHNGTCYHFSGDTTTWEGAYVSCNILNGHLVEIESAEENAYLLGRVNSLGGHWYIGCTDKRVENRYVWVTSKKAVNDGYTNWGSGEPNNAANDESCVVINSPRWADIQCERKEHYICESANVEEVIVG